MPKRVDHDDRRAKIAEATCLLIAERGVEGATMRAIASAIGMAHGALKHYFPDKNSIVRTAFTYVFDATNARVRERLDGEVGLAALRVFCGEIMPVGELTEREARVVLPFWQRALADEDLQRLYTESMTLWRTQVAGFLREARADGAVRTPTPDDVLAEQLLAMLNGLQALALLDRDATDVAMQWRMIDGFLDSLR